MAEVEYLRVEKHFVDPDTGEEYTLVGRQKCLWVRDHWEPTFIEGLQSEDGGSRIPFWAPKGNLNCLIPSAELRRELSRITIHDDGNNYHHYILAR